MINYDKIPSPAYVLDEARLRRNLELIQRVQQEASVQVILALKGFSMWRVFPMVKQYLAGATASSLHEARLIFEEMGTPAHTYSPAYLPAEFDEVMGYSSHITFNSLAQYERYKEQLARHAAPISAGLRVNPEFSVVETDLYNPSAPGSRLGEMVENLGGHCLETMLDAYERAASSDQPLFMLAYTIKGWRLPFQGHKDNHSGLMNPAQMAAFRDKMGVPEGREWAAFAGLKPEHAARCEAALKIAPFAQVQSRLRTAPPVAVPERFAPPDDKEISTQAAFGKILNEIGRQGGDLADAIVTMSPDVSVSTNLGAWVNRRGLFGRDAQEDMFRRRKIASAQIWSESPSGQHIELGIAEHNLFLTLAAFGLSAPLFGARLLPIGTLYDPFIARGLDALNYACYQDARFLLVATPSGLTLGPEGGAHQSINTPLIGMGQPGLTAYEPAFADEVAVLMRHAFEWMQKPEGESVYLRLSTRAIPQPQRSDDAFAADVIKGGYWLKTPKDGAELAIVVCGALAPEALAAHAQLLEDYPGLGLLAVTSPDLLHRGWRAAPGASHIETLLAPLAAHAGLVTLIDGSPAALSWLGGVRGQRVRALGVEGFGQTGDLPDLYRHYRLDVDAILDACAALALSSR
jgi:pyruvate dehydrogenase E1 component